MTKIGNNAQFNTHHVCCAAHSFSKFGGGPKIMCCTDQNESRIASTTILIDKSIGRLLQAIFNAASVRRAGILHNVGQENHNSGKIYEHT